MVLLVCFINALKSSGFLSNSEEELQKSKKKKLEKNKKPHNPSWVFKAFSCPVPEGVVNCKAFQLQKV